MTTLITANLNQTFQALRNRDPLKVQNQTIPDHQDYKRVPQRNYAPIGTTNTGSWGGVGNRSASIANSNLIYGQPQFFSPIHTNINWQMPSKRLEIYSWCRFFYDSEPKVASAIDFYSLFPMSDWDHECKDRKVKKYFDRLKTRLELPKWTRAISFETHLLGDSFPFLEMQCEHCNGHGKVGDEICEHEGGTIRRMVLLNPDYVDILSSPMNHEQTIVMRPDEELMTMITRKLPGHEKLHPDLARLILSGRPILLDKNCVSHVRYGANQNSKYGTGMLKRLFPILSYKTKLMMAQWTIAERLILPIKIVKVGSDERPAGPADIAAVQAQLAETANDPNLTIVTHHAFDLDFAGSAGKTLTISDQFEFISQEILDGLMINQALLNGDGPGYCLSDDSSILTDNGFKLREEIDIEKDLIATYNKTTGALEYQKAIKKYEYDHNSIDGNDIPLKHFSTDTIDMLVTHNHKMLFSRREKLTYGEWKVLDAKDVNSRGRFLGAVSSWEGPKPTVELIRLGIYSKLIKSNKIESIPKWIKALPVFELKNLIGKNMNFKSNTKTLRDDLIEVGIKLGYIVRFRFSNISSNWIIKFDKRAVKHLNINKKDISDVPYKGKVWCVEVPNHFIITERNGLIGIHGNSAAAVGQEAMIHRLTTFRKQMSEWITKNIYLPEAKRQGFIDEDVVEDDDEVEYIVPKIKWHKMHLRDEQQNRTFMIQLYEKGIVSAHTLLETFELDPDQEIERKRYDAIQMMALGQGGQTNDAGMGGGGMGGMGGGGMGGGGMGGPPMPDMGGGAPGGDAGGMGGLGGGGDMGGGTPPIAAGEGAPPPMAKTTLLTAETVDPSQFGGKILKKKTRERINLDQAKQQKREVRHQQELDTASPFRDAKGRIVYTKPERTLIAQIMKSQKDGIIKYPVKPQFEISAGDSTYLIDFAIIPLKIGIEADGEIFHSAPEQVKSDTKRDHALSQQGWTIIRFKEKEIENKLQDVMNRIYQAIAKKESFLKNQIQQIKDENGGKIVVASTQDQSEIQESYDIIESLEKMNQDIEGKQPN